MLEQVILFTILMGFLISVLLSPILIPFLRRLKFGQSIREEGPKSHQKKSGTPTMGGVMIILSIIVTTIVMTQKFSEISPEMFLLLFVTIGYGLLGFLDDYIKVVMKRNLGLTSKQKLIGQIIIALCFMRCIITTILRRISTFLGLICHLILDGLTLSLCYLCLSADQTPST